MKLPWVLDGHNDALYRFHRLNRPAQFFQRSSSGHLDLPRLRAGGWGGGLFAVFIMNPHPRRGRRDFPSLDPGLAMRDTLAMAGLLFRWEAASGGRFRVVRTVADLEQCIRERAVGAILHFEGAEAIDPALTSLEGWYGLGLRSLGLVWSRPNAFGRGVPLRFPGSPDQGSGLTAAGRRLVQACNRLGILLDLSHLNERGFWEVARRSRHPLVASHSGAHTLCRSPRNLTDRQLFAIRDSDGLVGVNFYTGFLREDGRDDPRTPLEEIVRHAEYIAARIGINHVALGSDFDGATVPRSLRDAAGTPRLLRAFHRRGFSQGDIAKIAHGNWLRVLRATWRRG